MLSHERLEQWLWRRLSPDMPIVQRGLIRALRMFWVLARELAEGQLSLRAMSLVYTTLLSIVPLLAVSFSVLKAFEVQNQLEPLLQRLLEPLGPQGQEVSDKIIEFVSNMKVGVLGAVGVGLLFYTVLSLLQKTERAFNDIWRVKQDRSFAQRFTEYLSVLIIGPVLVFSALGLTASLMNSSAVHAMSAWPVLGMLIAAVPNLLPYLLIIAAFTFGYSFVPNTKVSLSAAATGALFAGIIWQTTGWLFTAFLANAGSYTAIYSAFATLILFMIWLYLSWLILLLGASIAFYVQHPESVRLHPVILGNRGREETGLALLWHIAEALYAGRRPPTLRELSARLDQPSLELDESLTRLIEGGFLLLSQDDPPRYAPAKPLDTTPLTAVLVCLRGRSAHLDAHVADLMAELDQAVLARLDGRTIKDWVCSARESG